MDSPPPYRVTFVCTGNICRSPIAAVVFAKAVQDAGLADRVTVASAGTGDWHVGDGADARALQVLRRAGYDGASHRARQFAATDVPVTDLVVALDHGHARALRALAGADDEARVVLLRSFDPAVADEDPASPEMEVDDPYFGGMEGFDTVLAQVEAATPGLLDRVRAATAP